MTSRSVCGGILGLLWGLALWASWECRGLYLDGSYYLLEAIRAGGFMAYDFSPSRAFAIWATQVPVAVAIAIGLEDTHWLARLYSLGLLGLPTALYSLALWRARDDPALLALVITAIALVFQTTSFFIVGEYNTAYALAILAATLVSVGRNDVRDGGILLALAMLGLKTYETLVYLGPLLAGLMLWRTRMVARRSVGASALYGLSGLVFLAAGVLAIGPIVDPEKADYLRSVIAHSSRFWQNLSFDLVLAAVVSLAFWALLRPRDLGRWPPYALAGVFLALLALTPLLAVGRLLVGSPYGYSQTVARTAAGPVVAILCVLIWGHGRGWFAPAPAVARRLLAFSGLMVAATLPWNIMLTTIYAAYLQELRTTIRKQSGPIAFEQTRLTHAPRLTQGESWSLVSLSLLLRSAPDDGVILPPKDYTGWRPPELAPSLDLGRFRWRD